jgi:transcriptional regulator with XRE-family HTH domain
MSDLSVDPGGGSFEPEAVAQSFGAVLREARRVRGVTQERLAEAVGVDRTYISMLERGIHQPSLSVFLRLADALGVAPEEFVGGVVRGVRGEV